MCDPGVDEHWQGGARGGDHDHTRLVTIAVWVPVPAGGGTDLGNSPDSERESLEDREFAHSHAPVYASPFFWVFDPWL